MSYLFRMIPRMSLVLLAVAVFSGCGIDKYEQFAAPTMLSSPSDSTITFRHSTENNSDRFAGYLVFYRIYGGNDQAAPPSAMDSDASRILSATASPEIAIAALNNARYHLMSAKSDSDSSAIDMPVVRVAEANVLQNVVASLDLYSGDGYITVDDVTTKEFKVYRNQELVSANGYLVFTPVPGDAFTTEADCDTSAGSAYFWVSAYVVAFGMKDDFSSIYSLPIQALSKVQIATSG